jgi:hypothetical protein
VALARGAVKAGTLGGPLGDTDYRPLFSTKQVLVPWNTPAFGSPRPKVTPSGGWGKSGPIPTRTLRLAHFPRTLRPVVFGPVCPETAHAVFCASPVWPAGRYLKLCAGISHGTCEHVRQKMALRGQVAALATRRWIRAVESPVGPTVMGATVPNQSWNVNLQIQSTCGRVRGICGHSAEDRSPKDPARYIVISFAMPCYAMLCYDR